MTPIAGFLPDADPTMPGVIPQAENLIPTQRGYQDAPQIEELTDAVPGVPNSGAMLLKLDGSARLLVGAHNGIWEMSSSGWAQRLALGVGVSDAWSFRQFGDVSLATSYNDTLNQSNSGAFTPISGAPDAMTICVTSTHQVMAVGHAAQTDEWWCSALGDHTDWTPAAATQSAKGRFLATPGIMTGSIEFGPHILAFKERSMYWMRYVNVPMIWQTEVISNEVGSISPQCILDVGNRVLFIGPDDFYSFDGTRPVSIGAGIREWFFSRLNWTWRYYAAGVYDPVTQCAWWWYPRGDSTELRNAVVYHVPTGRWGHASAWIRVPMIVRESALSSTGEYASAVFTPHVLGAISGFNKAGVFRRRTAAAQFRLGWMGDDLISSTLTKLRPRFIRHPVSGSVRFFKSEDLATEIEVGMGNLREGAFGTQQNAHWHSAELTLQGPFEITAIGNDIPRPGGKR